MWKWKCYLFILSDSLRPHGLWPTRLLCPWNSPGKNTGVGCHSLLQGICSTQGSNLGFPPCRQILYHLSHLGNSIREWLCLNILEFLTPEFIISQLWRFRGCIVDWTTGEKKRLFFFGGGEVTKTFEREFLLPAIRFYHCSFPAK